MLLGIVMLTLLFLAPGVVLPFLTNLLPISTFTAKIALAGVGFIFAVVGGILSVPGIINNIMYKNSPSGAPGGSGKITSISTKNVQTINNQLNQLDQLDQLNTQIIQERSPSQSNINDM